MTNETGIYVGMGIVFAYAVFGGMKGITYTQVAQYIVLIFAYRSRPSSSRWPHRQPDPATRARFQPRPAGCFACWTKLEPGGDRPGLRQIHHVPAGETAR